MQSRQFGTGEAKVLFKFQMMHEDLRTKRAHISHSEVPTEFISNYLGSKVGKEDKEVGEVVPKKHTKKIPIIGILN